MTTGRINQVTILQAVDPAPPGEDETSTRGVQGTTTRSSPPRRRWGQKL